jgi:hypothetical protein
MGSTCFDSVRKVGRCLGKDGDFTVKEGDLIIKEGSGEVGSGSGLSLRRLGIGKYNFFSGGFVVKEGNSGENGRGSFIKDDVSFVKDSIGGSPSGVNGLNFRIIIILFIF